LAALKAKTLNGKVLSF